MYSLGIDIGSSSVKVSLLDVESGKCVASAGWPKSEAPIKAVRPGWAEQSPEDWWDYVLKAISEIRQHHSLGGVKAVGITYQMHGMVAVDKDIRPVRDAIIWCDSRAVGIGEEALEGIGYDRCMSHLLNSPGNFTASKLAWVLRNEPELCKKIRKYMLPGDYIAWKLTGELATTVTGLSEQILWDFKESRRADFVAEYYGIDPALIPDTVPAIGFQARTTSDIEALTGIPAGTPICYRAGDQPNNAFSLDVLEPGEVAATGGTSGVVYGVTDVPKADKYSRVNTFVHVNDTPSAHRYGVLLCINGTGILNSWMRRTLAPEGASYPEMNDIAATAPVGSDGVRILPFGNGAERMLGNRSPLCAIKGVDFNRHTRAHLLRAAQEGIAFSFKYGIDIMKGLGLDLKVIRAGKANLFLSPLFRTTLATLCRADIELFDTDGSLGAARGAALGAGLYHSAKEAFGTLSLLESVHQEPTWSEALGDAYSSWRDSLDKEL